MSDLRVRISAPTFNEHPTAEQSFAGVNDINPNQITLDEARRALEVVNTFRNAHAGIQDNQIQIQVGEIHALTIGELRRVAGVQIQTQFSEATTSWSPWAIPANANLFALRQGGNNGGSTYRGTNLEAGFLYNF